jgi:3-phenylpropionate/trans-cinnamate dioxygenase subunit beta
MSINNRVSLEDIRAVEQFLYREARLLDQRKFTAWLDVLDESIRYYMPNRKVRKPQSRSDAWDVEDELSGQGELGLLSDNILTLSVRATRLMDGLSFSENPMSRTVRLISNIEVQPAGQENAFQVNSNFHLNSKRLEKEEVDFYGSRQDIILARDDEFFLQERRVVLNTTVLNAPCISLFF